MSTYGYLAHHGVKGQKWGVRNGPPYPIEDKILAKGTKLSRVQLKPSDNKDWKYVYREDEKWDKKVYEGAFSKYLKMRYKTQDAVQKVQYETVKDLKMPTKAERKNELINIFKDKAIDDFKKWEMYYEIYDSNSIREEGGLIHSSKLKSPNSSNILNEIISNKELQNEMYDAFTRMIDNKDWKIVKEYREKINKKYDAMVDDNNVNVYNRVHDPLIIFNVENALKEIGKYTLNDTDIEENTNFVKNELKDKFTIN